MNTQQIDQIILQIADIQANADERFFPEGIFPSYRRHPFLPYQRPDTNVFCTVLVLFTLQRIVSKLSDSSQQLVQQMTQKTVQQYPLFQNKNGLKTYNFFPTQPPKPFGNGYLLHRFKHFELADDADDTALVYLTSPHTQEDAQWLQNKLSQHVLQKNPKSTFPEYQHLQAYTTWFGKKMPLEFDACVLCNVLYFIFENKLPITQHEEDSLFFLEQIMVTNQYLTHPFEVSHHYARTEVIIYHITRLMDRFKIGILENCKEKLIKDIYQLLENQNIEQYYKLLLETSLLRLGEKPIHQKLVSEDIKTQPFFIAGFLSSYQNPLLLRLARLKLFQFEWICEAHTLALQVENLALQV